MKIPTPKKNIGNPSITTANTTPAGTPSQVRKHSIPELISLTEKWKDVCKQVHAQLRLPNYFYIFPPLFKSITVFFPLHIIQSNINSFYSMCLTCLRKVLHELKEHSKDPDVDYPKILDFFRIEPDILRYNAEEDCLE